MNKKGQVAILGLMVAVFVILMAIILADPLGEIIADARDPSNLDCSNTSISTGQRITCLEVDLMLPLFIGAVVAIGIAWAKRN